MAANSGNSIQATVAFGQKLALLLQTCVDLSLAWKVKLKPILADISTTSSVLQELGGLVDMNQLTVSGKPAAEVLTKSGLREIETLAVKCDLLYKIIMLLLQKAADRDEESSTKDNKEIESLGAKLLNDSVPDPSSLLSLGIVRKCFDRRHWLNIRFDRCNEQLRWVKQGLFIMLHIVKLARLQLSSVEREDGTFEQELFARATIRALRNGSVKYTERKARKQEKAQRQWELRAKSDDTDSSSISSSASSTKSGTTAVDGQQSSKEETIGVTDNNVQAGQEKKTISFSSGGKDTHFPPFGVVVKKESSTPEKETSPSEKASGAGQASAVVIDNRAKPLCSFSCSISLNMKLPIQITDWTHRIFGKDDAFKKDWESNDLEAYIYESVMGYMAHRQPRKVPFGHRRLHYGLNQVLKDRDKLGSTWDRYIGLGPSNRWVVDEVSREANKFQTRARICIALQEINKDGKDPAMLIFFSICEEKRPIVLKGPTGETYMMPSQRCRTLEGLKNAIKEAFNYTPELGPHVMEGHFDIINSKGDILLSKSIIQPGERLAMRMWPLTTPLLVVHNSPPYWLGPPPGPRPGAQAHYNEIMRMRRLEQDAAMPRAIGGVGFPPPPPPPPMRRCRSLSKSPIDENAISEEEDKQLMVIDFVKEKEKNQTVTVADLLARYTALKDTQGKDCLDAIFSDDAYSSDCSSSSSSSSEILDD